MLASFEVRRAVPQWRANRWLGYCACFLVGCSFPKHEFSDALSSAGAGSGDTAGAGGGGRDPIGGGGAGGDVTSPRAGATGLVTEICDNRVDDDADGRIDCADADCEAANWVCLPAIPVGWAGPIVMASAPSVTQLPNCEDSGGYWQAVSSSWCSKVSATESRCTACPPCSAVENLRKVVGVNLTTNCSGSCISNEATDCRLKLSEGCQRVQLEQSVLVAGASLSQLSVIVDVPVYSGGTCQSPTPSGVVSEPPDAKCTEPLLVCKGPAMGTCSFAGTGCILKPRSPFGPRPCIYAIGSQPACPAGWDRPRQIAYTNVTDTRGCSACNCSPPSSSAYVDPTVFVTDYGPNENCQGSGRASAGKLGCFGGLQAEFEDGVMSRYLSVSFPMAPPLCSQTGGKPIGSVETQSPVTICCATL